MVRRGGVVVAGLGLGAIVFVLGLGGGAPAGAVEPACNWLGEDIPLPLPLTVETPRDIAFKGAAERQYLILNLLAGGKLAWQRGDYAGAVQKWESLLRTPGLDPQIQSTVSPFLTEARERLAQSSRDGVYALRASPRRISRIHSHHRRSHHGRPEHCAG